MLDKGICSGNIKTRQFKNIYLQILRYLFFLIWPQRQLLWEFVLATKQSFDWFWFVSLSHRSFANNLRKPVKIITDILMMVTLFHFMYSDFMFHNLPPLSIVRKSTFVSVEINHKGIIINLNKQDFKITIFLTFEVDKDEIYIWRHWAILCKQLATSVTLSLWWRYHLTPPWAP